MNCPLCESQSVKELYQSTLKQHDTQYTVTEKDIGVHGTMMTCNVCTFTWISDFDVVVELSKSYIISQVDEYYEAEYQGRLATNKKIINHIKKFLSPPSNLLDIGCYTGMFVNTAKDNGYNAFGLEPSKAAVNRAVQKKLNITNGSVEEISQYFKNDYFEIVTAFDVIEHLSDPHILPASASAVLKRGGILVLSTPDISSVLAKISGEKWHAIIPHHLAFYSAKSLRLLLEKHGFKVISTTRLTRFFSCGYLVAILKQRSRLLGKLFGWLGKGIFAKINLPVNLFDQVVIYAKKQ